MDTPTSSSLRTPAERPVSRRNTWQTPPTGEPRLPKLSLLPPAQRRRLRPHWPRTFIFTAAVAVAMVLVAEATIFVIGQASVREEAAILRREISLYAPRAKEAHLLQLQLAARVQVPGKVTVHPTHQGGLLISLLKLVPKGANVTNYSDTDGQVVLQYSAADWATGIAFGQTIEKSGLVQGLQVNATTGTGPVVFQMSGTVGVGQ